MSIYNYSLTIVKRSIIYLYCYDNIDRGERDPPRKAKKKEMIKMEEKLCCPACKDEGCFVTLQCIGGDEAGLEYECPRCNRVLWIPQSKNEFCDFI